VCCQIANRLWNLSLRREAQTFWLCLDNIATTQEELLLKMLRENCATEYGRKHGFSAIRSARQYQKTVPLSDYSDFEPYVDRIRAGNKSVLTAEPVLLMEPTGGSSSGGKLIPYTAGLKRQFQRGIAPWIVALYRSYPELLNGESYWSVSPATGQLSGNESGIRIGFDDDSEYVGGLGRLLVRSLLAVPDQVKLVVQMENFWYVTLLFLLRSRYLSLISVWNPSFLTILCGHLEEWWQGLADDIAQGTLTPPLPLDRALAARLTRLNRPDPVRAREIVNACRVNNDFTKRQQRLWPRLRLVSCWADGAAQEGAEELRQSFPGAVIQGKGLLATEGFFTIPMTGMDGCLPALRSHFLEFLPQDGEGALLLHQLELGRTYSLVATTAGGLYRYRLHDLVTVTAFHNKAPLLRFVGKEDHIADHTGEKLHENHVCAVLCRVADENGLKPDLAMLAFAQQPTPGYVYLVETVAASDEKLLQMAKEIDEQLKDNFHYRYSRDLGQLAAVRVFRIAVAGRESYLKNCCRRGQRLGDVKPLALLRGQGWVEDFQGRMLISAR
jgi:hypothetical protein